MSYVCMKEEERGNLITTATSFRNRSAWVIYKRFDELDDRNACGIDRSKRRIYPSLDDCRRQPREEDFWNCTDFPCNRRRMIRTHHSIDGSSDRPCHMPCSCVVVWMMRDNIRLPRDRLSCIGNQDRPQRHCSMKVMSSDIAS